MTFFLLSVLVFTGTICLLVYGLMAASNALSPGGTVTLDINDGQKTLEVPPGDTLLSSLASNDIFLPSACGGGGTCAMCKCQVKEGGGQILPTEKGQISKPEQKEGTRLSCQLKVKEDLKIEVPPEVMEIKKFEATVRSNDNVATFIKELIVDLPEGVDLNFKAGGYIQMDVPKYDIKFKDFEIGEEYRDDWEKFGLFDLEHQNDEEVFRAYSMANHPAEGNMVMLNIRIAVPPRGLDVPPGVCSTFTFSLKPGDKVTLSGPYGEFFIRDSDREMCYIGGGAGMAPLRSHIFHLFHTQKTDRKVTFWYGGRSKKELFYMEDFEDIKNNFDNFDYTVALSEPQPEDDWDGPTGFIHTVCEEYLLQHDDPEEVEYYMCGPPPMIAAANNMLFNIGVEKEMISYDEFS